MKYAVTSYGVHRTMTIDQLIPRLGELNYDGVEVWGKDLENASEDRVLEIKAAADAQGLQVCATSPYFDFVPGGERWRKGVEACRTHCAQARALGATIMRYREVDYIPSADMDNKMWSSCIDGLKALAGLAMPDLIVGIECHENLPQDSPENITMMIEKIGMPNVKVIFQPSSYMGKDQLGILDQLYEHVVHVHLGNRPKVSGKAADGSDLKCDLGDPDGVMDYDSIFADLKKRG
ncbi:MAG: sugar phosphate isomerase/epimerase [Candidatus Latescibacteria bacterium]|nr:sugar phosphate isomerase/epimerase [Candidatus Latescibacterota bacterium]